LNLNDQNINGLYVKLRHYLKMTSVDD